jgi:hypothetical protein
VTLRGAPAATREAVTRALFARLGADSYLCLDIHLNTMAVMEVRSGTVVRWFRQAVQPEWIKQGDLVNPEALAEMLRAGVAARGMRGRRVRMTLSDQAAVIRRVTLPLMSKRDLSGGMMYAAEREMPFPPQRAVYAWDVLSTNGSVTVAIAGAWKDVVDRAASVVFQAGLTPTVIEPRSVALGRALNSENAVIVDGSREWLDLTVLAGGHPVFTDTALRRSGLDGAATEVTALIDRGIRQVPMAVSYPILLLGDLEAQVERIDFPARPGTSLLNGKSPDQPQDLPTAAFLANFGLAMR